MFDCQNDFMNWVYADRHNAKKFLKDLDTTYRRGLVVVLDAEEQTIITSFPLYRRHKRLKH